VPGSTFGTAIYTNCGPGQGLDGVAGMQFQSRSAGVDREALTVIRRHLLYEPPDRLMLEQQPVESFPPSFAHVCDGVFATAAGRYLGREAAGGRQGNHLTDAIVTSDPLAYRSVRPVQLFLAPFWRAQPAAGKESEALPPSWRPGPFDAARAGQFVREQPDGPARLSAILTALLAHLGPPGETDPRRVLFISERADPVLLWLTAATLLIPQRQAVRLGFKVFTADPARCDLPVVAVHPDWVKSAATVDHDRGYLVFDLTSGRWTPVKPSAEARHWAHWFCQADPYEVTEAVELAAASGLAEPAARELAMVAVLHQPPSGSGGELVRWLRTGPPALREAYGGSLAVALTELRDLPLLREVDSAADSQFPARRDQVRLLLFQRELDSALRAPMMFQPQQPRRPVPAALQPQAQRLVAEGMRGAPSPAFDAILRVSNRFDVPVPLADVRDSTERFVDDWASHPDSPYEVVAWPVSLPLADMLRQRLLDNLEKDPTIPDRWWNHLPLWAPDQADLESPLERALLSAAMANRGPPERLRIVRNLLRPPGTAAGPVDYRGLARVLWFRTWPSSDELRTLGDAVPPGTALDHKLFDGLLAAARADPAEIPELELCGHLAARRLLTLDPATQQALEDHRWLQGFERQLDPSLATPQADERLLSLTPGVLNAHARPLAQTLLGCGDPRRVHYLLSLLPEPVQVAYLRAVSGYSLLSLDPARVALTVATCARLGVRPALDRPKPEGPGARAGHATYLNLDTWCRDASKRHINQVTRFLGLFDAGVEASWQHYAQQLRKLPPWYSSGEPGQ
jgi:GTPase-associated protein 1, N-terminal domain type 2/GTPase-associated protein 1, middle domain